MRTWLVFAWTVTNVVSIGAPISKLTDILVTDISAIKNTNTDANTDIAAPFNYDIFIIQMANHWWSTTFIYLLHTQFMAFLCDIRTSIVNLHIVLNAEDRPKFTCSSKYRLANTNFCRYRYHQNGCFDTDANTDINIGASLVVSCSIYCTPEHCVSLQGINDNNNHMTDG